MKKGLSLVMALCMALLLAVPVFADGRGPTFTSYDVVCKKDTPYYRENWDDDDDVENGVMEKQGTFPAGTKLTVEYEYEANGVLYGDVQIGEDEDMEWAYVRLSDVEIKDNEYLPKKNQRLAEPRSVRVIEKGGVPMYKGPNKKYEVITNIPRGTKLTYEYSNDQADYFRTWAYVTYFGKSGWIYVYTNDTKNGVVDLPDKDEQMEIWVLADDVKMFSGLSFGNIEDEFGEGWNEDYLREQHEEPDRVVATLEKGEKYTCRYSHGSDFGKWYYVSAGLRSGWVFKSPDKGNIAATLDKRQNDLYLTFRPGELMLRETPSENSVGTTVKLEKDVVLNPEYTTSTEDGTFYYDTIEGQSGWFSYFDVQEFGAEKWHVYEDEDGLESDMTNENDRPAPIYSDVVEKDTTVGQIPAGEKCTTLYRGDYEVEIDEENSEYVWFYYVDYKGTTGWVVGRDLYDPDAEGVDESGDLPDDELTEDDDTLDDEDWEDEGYGGLEEDFADEQIEDEPEIDADPSEIASASHNSLSPLQIVLFCVGGAVVLALTAAVTLLLIRRKRKAQAAPASETEAAQMLTGAREDDTQDQN